MNDGVTWADAPVIVCLCLGLYASFFGLGEYDPRFNHQAFRAMAWPHRAACIVFALLFWASALLFLLMIGYGYGILFLCLAFAGFWFPLLPLLGMTSLPPDFGNRPIWVAAQVYALLIALALVCALASAIIFR